MLSCCSRFWYGYYAKQGSNSFTPIKFELLVFYTFGVGKVVTFGGSNANATIPPIRCSLSSFSFLHGLFRDYKRVATKTFFWNFGLFRGLGIMEECSFFSAKTEKKKKAEKNNNKVARLYLELII